MDEGPSPSTLVAKTVIVMLVKSEHAEVSNMWLHCPLMHADSEVEIVTQSHIFPEVDSEYVIV